jgi:hypothetical protein
MSYVEGSARSGSNTPALTFSSSRLDPLQSELDDRRNETSPLRTVTLASDLSPESESSPKRSFTNTDIETNASNSQGSTKRQKTYITAPDLDYQDMDLFDLEPVIASRVAVRRSNSQRQLPYLGHRQVPTPPRSTLSSNRRNAFYDDSGGTMDDTQPFSPPLTDSCRNSQWNYSERYGLVLPIGAVDQEKAKLRQPVASFVGRPIGDMGTENVENVWPGGYRASNPLAASGANQP